MQEYIYKTERFYQSPSEPDGLAAFANSKARDGWRVVSCSSVTHEFVHQGSNHGRGGSIRAQYLLLLEHTYDPSLDDELVSF